MENKLEKRYDTKGWQWDSGGQIMLLEEMSREDLMEALCRSISTIHQLSALSGAFTNVIDRWEKDKKPKLPVIDPDPFVL